MQNGYVIKNSTHADPLDSDLALINSYTRRELKKDEVYVFSVVLCDNEIDRDYERFSKESLHKLADLYIGKTGIFDHEAKSENQTARIFSCEVRQIDGKLNSLGEQYLQLVARAYMPRSSKNEDFILNIDSGIVKEVSVSCSVENVTCSICGADMKLAPCRHIKGKKYGDNPIVCHSILDNPIDAYEWSFVAIPAQKDAGVIKGFKSNKVEGADSMHNILKKISLGESVNITKNQAIELNNYISDLEQKANDGIIYKNDLQKEVTRLCCIAQPEIETKIINDVAKKMTIEELKAFKKSFEASANEVIPVKPQLTPNKKEKINYQNNEFRI